MVNDKKLADSKKRNCDCSSSSSSDEDIGGPFKEDSNKPIIQEAAKQALRVYNKRTSDLDYRFIIKILESRAGFFGGHTITLLLGKTKYKKWDISLEEFEKLADVSEIDKNDRKIILAFCSRCKEEPNGEVGSNRWDIQLRSDDYSINYASEIMFPK